MATINGTTGNDDLDEIEDGGSTSSNDVIYGLGGDDTITVYPNFRTVDGQPTPVTDTVDGGEGDDTLRFTVGTSTFNLSLLADPNGGYRGSFVQGQVWRVDYAGIENFDVTLTAGGTIATGDGDDRITDAGGGNANMDSGAGDDVIVSNGGTATATMGAGSDRLVIDASSFSGNLGLTGDALGGTLADGYSGTYFANQFGGVAFSGVEHFTITGSNSDDIRTGDGDDIINAVRGNDFVSVGRGNDIVDGGDDIDRLRIDLSDEAMGVGIDLTASGEQQTGGTGSIRNFETFYGTVTGSDFGDRLIEGAYLVDAVFSTGRGNDYVEVRRGNDTINMGDGNDRFALDMTGASGNLTFRITGGSLAAGYAGTYVANQVGSGSFSGTENFTVTSGELADDITTGDGNDVVRTAGSNDEVTIGRGNDVADGGEGVDRLSIDLSDEAAGVGIDLTATGEQQTGGTGSIRNFETFHGIVTGSGFADRFVEGAHLVGTVFDTGGGADYVEVRRGDDTIDMGEGDDRLAVDITGASGNLTFRITGGTLATGYSGTYVANQVGTGRFSGVESFTVTGGGLADAITTGDGADIVRGNDGGDVIDTAGGDDAILGLGEGSGLTRATGGAGSDRFAVGAGAALDGASVDYITDFRFGAGGDLLDVRAFFDATDGTAQGYTAGTDPFSAGYLRFVAGDGDGDGAADDVLLQVDRDGRTGDAGFRTAVVLQNVALAAVERGNVVLPTVNAAPVANADDYTVDEDSSLTGNVLGNDDDPDDDALTATLVDDVATGTLDFNADGSFTYTSDRDANGPVSFTYRASDGQATSGLTTVTIAVTPVNDAPVAGNDGGFATGYQRPLTIEPVLLLANDGDVDGDALDIVSVGNAVNGTVTLDGQGRPVFTPASGFSGAASFSYTVSDDKGGTATATVSLTVGDAPPPDNEAPTAASDGYATSEDVVLTVAGPGVLGNDADADDDPLTAVLVAGPANGTLTLNADGSFSYTPKANFNGTESFTYRASDGNAQSAAATVTITVAPVNDAPDAANDAGFATAFDTPLTLDPAQLLANDGDVDGDALALLSVQGAVGGTVALDGQGRPVFTPTAGFSGAASFTYTASDGKGGVDTATVSLAVAPAPDGLPDCEVVTRAGTVDGSAASGDNLTGPAYHNSYYFDLVSATGRDTIADFGKDDVLVTGGKLFDGNNDGIITFGSNGVLNLDGPVRRSDTVALTGVGGLRLLGESCEGIFVYADVAVRPKGAIEGTLGNDVLRGDAGDRSAQTFFFDTALDLDLGVDRIENFGAKDEIVTTSKLFDGNGDGLVQFGRNRLLDLSGGTGGPDDPGAPGEAGNIALLGMSGAAGRAITTLQFDGTTAANGVTYYHYSLVDVAGPTMLAG